MFYIMYVYLNFKLLFILWVRAFCFDMCMCTMYIWYLQRSEESTDSPELKLQ